ncbi:DNA translocase FtsK [Alkalicoccobacillus murimartini]|uniref:S-DNA-T family DNA segregation ATPase FtsK/SpoIIIE n=1 Tax=Alkalicoccobacillus murimartini TaxID=171685 RepID=A0ABT9YJX1_9BACI|nr:DNA translocase FtsK [Alkalicoccobacillus murimartini]MDQ0208159.1 S-DNA-T family DNA segregation ATPase FtsK/SpoIIIE [Alkalicoccobacillus murimartini]
MEPIQRLRKWIQQTFYGVEQNEKDENKKETESSNVQQSKQVDRRSSHTYPSYQEPSDKGPRITYQYARSNGIRFPLEVEEQAKEMMQDRKADTPKPDKSHESVEKHVDRTGKSTREEPTKKVEKKERVKFNNPDFKPTSIPSPIHGFRKVLPSQRTQLTLHEPEVEPTKITEESIPQTFFSESTKEVHQVVDHKDEEDAIQDTTFTLSESSYAQEESKKEEIVTEPVQEIEEDIATNPHPVESNEEVVYIPVEKVEEIVPEQDDTYTAEPIEQKTQSTLEVIEPQPEILELEEAASEQSSEKEENPHSDYEEPIVEDESPFYEEPTIEVKEEQQPVVEPVKTKQPTKENTAFTSQTKQKASVPFNVLMMPKDKKTATPSTTKEVESNSGYMKPSIQLLRYPEAKRVMDTEWLDQQAVLLEETLQSFHVDAKVVHTTMGPSVTRFEIQPARGVKVNKVTNLSDDIKMTLSAKEIRIEAPIPGKNTIGIEVPNLHPEAVWLREILRRDVFIQPSSPMTVALGLDISGQPIVTDLRKMPHGLVAGATGSGKSVCINSILISLLYKATPDEVKLLLVDPKMVELAPYNDVPHLVAPVITDAKQATIALKWVVGEMERRYEQFSQKGVRDVGRYNELYSEEPSKPAMPYILVVIDELADLMMVSPQEVEDSICRIAQKARACGIHLLVATQRPSVDVITGLIKANIPTRIAFSVSSQTDSRTILDMNGAERLLGRGDMLFNENGSPKPVRVQGTFVTDEEIEDVISYVKKQRKPEFMFDTEQMQKSYEQSEQEDDLFEEACYHVINQGTASASNLQRRFRIGYNRAARLIDMLEARGVITGAMGSKPRQVLIDEMSVDQVLGYTE